MPRLQFRLSTLLWITLAVACWFGGVRFERWRAETAEQEEPTPTSIMGGGWGPHHYTITTWSDGHRTIERPVVNDANVARWEAELEAMREAMKKAGFPIGECEQRHRETGLPRFVDWDWRRAVED